MHRDEIILKHNIESLQDQLPGHKMRLNNLYAPQQQTYRRSRIVRYGSDPALYYEVTEIREEC